MKHQTGTFQTSDGLELYYQSWTPDELSLLAFIIIHGFSEHCGRYPHLVERLNQDNIAVYGFDQRGFGRSPGQRGHIDRWEEYCQDVRNFIQLVRSQEPGRPVFLYGHSMGTVTALEYALSSPDELAGVIASGGPFEPFGVGSPLLKMIARGLSRLWPTFSLPLKINPQELSRNPEVIESYRSDPLVNYSATARWGTEVLDAIERIKARACDLKVPVLVIHGEADRLNSADGAHQYFESLTCPDKTIRIYPETLHEPHNDLDHARVLDEMTDWLLQHKTA